jgi:Type I restriction modification DNA specificity domain
MARTLRGGGELIDYQAFMFKNLFNNIKQGRRLRKEDQLSGNIPFVMAGNTNTGVVNYISNPVANFPKNSITIDIFGNTFYRDYDFGAGDDTGVYWNNEKKYSKETMLFLATSMKNSISGKFDFGNKLRSSQSLNFKMLLPVINNQPDYALMETLISAIQKLVIKDLVLYVDEKRAATGV